jgi:hypothetical protein
MPDFPEFGPDRPFVDASFRIICHNESVGMGDFTGQLVGKRAVNWLPWSAREG